MTNTVHFRLDISHEIIGILIIPHIVVRILNGLRFGNGSEFDDICKSKENDTGHDPSEENCDFKNEENSDVIPSTGLEPVLHSGFTKVNCEQEWNL